MSERSDLLKACEDAEKALADHVAERLSSLAGPGVKMNLTVHIRERTVSVKREPPAVVGDPKT